MEVQERTEQEALGTTEQTVQAAPGNEGQASQTAQDAASGDTARGDAAPRGAGQQTYDKAEKIKDDLLNVGGFRFSTTADAKTAEEEYKKMKYIQNRMNPDNPEEILAIYDKMIENGLFVTPVGIDFLMRTREFLIDRAGIDPDRVRPIETGTLFTQRAINEVRAAERPRVTTNLSEEIKEIRHKYVIATACAVISTILVIAMFIIAMTSDTPNMINYKNVLENQYADWEESLEVREQELREKEEALNGQN